VTLLAAVAGAVAISFSAILYALAGVSPGTGAFFRLFYALPVLFVLWWARRDRDLRSPKRRMVALVAGIFLGFDILVWHISIEYIGAGLSTLIANSQVVVVALAAWAFLGEKPSREVTIAVPIVLLGVSLVSGLGRGDAFGSSPLLGTILALASAVLYAGFILGFRVSNESQAPSAGPLLESTAGAAIAILFTSIPFGGIEFTPTWPEHGWLLTLALTSQVAGWLLIGYALPRLPAVETATIILLQPVLTMIWAVLIFSEQPSAIQWVGAAMVLAGVGFVAVSRARRSVVMASAT
jgi:drug/metabolite transporter (DMT)-like permease